MGIERDTDLRGQKVTPNEDSDATRDFRVVGRVSADGGGSFFVADLGEDGLCALVSEGYVRDNYDIDDRPEPDPDNEPVTDDPDVTPNNEDDTNVH